MKNIGTFIIALVVALPALADWSSLNALTNSGWSEILFVVPPNGATRIVQPQNMHTNVVDQSSIGTNVYGAVWGVGEWVKFESSITVCRNEYTGVTNRVIAIPVPDDLDTYRVTFAGGDSDASYTNVQFGAVRTIIPAGGCALIGVPFLSAMDEYHLLAAFGRQVMTEYQLSATQYWGAAFMASFTTNWIGLMPHGAQVATYNNSDSNWYAVQFDATATTYGDQGWHPGGREGPSVSPGNGMMISNPSTNRSLTISMAGTCFSGSVTSSIPSGWSVVSAINGDSGELLGLNFPYDANTVIKRWDSTNSQWITYCATNSLQPGLSPGVWDTNQPGYEPVIEAGEAFLCYQAQAKEWVMNGASAPVFYTSNTSTNFDLTVLSQTSSNLTLALLNSTSNAVYIVETRTNVASGSWESVLTNTSTNATANPLPPISRSGDTLYFRARSQ